MYGVRRVGLPVALQADLKKTAPRPPGCYRLLALVVSVYLALVNAVTAVEVSTIKQDINISYPIWLRAALSITWAAIFVISAIGLIRQPLRALRFAAPVLTVYGICSLIWLAGFSSSDYDRGRVTFQLALTAILLAPVWWLNFRRFPLRI